MNVAKVAAGVFVGNCAFGIVAAFVVALIR